MCLGVVLVTVARWGELASSWRLGLEYVVVVVKGGCIGLDCVFGALFGKGGRRRIYTHFLESAQRGPLI